MIYYIILFIILIFLAYIMGILTTIDKHLQNFSTFDEKINEKINEHFVDKKIYSKKNEGYSIKNKNIPSSVEAFNNQDSHYILNNIIPDVKSQIICYKNHPHNKCLRGDMNYDDPYLMSPIDKRYFKYNYQPNLTLQDYINWLWIYDTSEEELPYIHMRNLQKLKNNIQLKYQEGILPPKSNIQIPKSTEEYFNKMYNSELDINNPLEVKKMIYDGYNYNEYPTLAKKSDKNIKPKENNM